MAARLIAALLLLCLSPLAPALTLAGDTGTAQAACSCCRGMRACCCRHGGAPGWHSLPQCQGKCHGTPATAGGLAFIPAPVLASAMISIARRPRIASLRTAPRVAPIHSPLFQRPPPPFKSDLG